jgi:hypothetical protein
MTTAWVGPDGYQKLRADLERAALALAKARHAAISGPLMISLELEYFGFNVYRDPSLHRQGVHTFHHQGEFNLFIRLIDETRPRQPRKGDTRPRKGGRNSGGGSGNRPTKAFRPLPAIAKAGTNIPQGWVVAPPPTARTVQE